MVPLPPKPFGSICHLNCCKPQPVILHGGSILIGSKPKAPSAKHVDIDARYFLLLPWEAKPVRRVEEALGNVPLGAQYAAFGTA